VLVLALGSLGTIGGVTAQPLPSDADIRDQLDQVVGNRVEAAAILGGQEVPQGGLFGWEFNDVDAQIFKYPWSADIGAPRPLGPGGLAWTPVLQGSIGATRFTNRFLQGPLVGSESTYSAYSGSIGGGPRIWLLPELSVLPTLGLLYAYTENDFDAGDERGRTIEQSIDGRLVNWHTHTLTFIPGLALRYQKTVERLTAEFTSSYSYFATVPLARSTNAYSFTAESHVWANRLELDVRTPWAVAGWPVVTGGFLQRAELLGGINDSLRSDHVYTVGGHVALDPKGRLWKLSQLGVAGSYFWSSAFSGWTLGLDWTVRF
jgi:hypothetical protein